MGLLTTGEIKRVNTWVVVNAEKPNRIGDIGVR